MYFLQLLCLMIEEGWSQQMQLDGRKYKQTGLDKNFV